jgi:hypothetical protein
VIAHLKSQKIVAQRKGKEAHSDLWKIALGRHPELSAEEKQKTENNRALLASATVAPETTASSKGKRPRSNLRAPTPP